MDREAEIVFISEYTLLVMNISPIREILPFLNGIFFHLTLKNDSNNQPIEITEDGKNGVIDFLERKYSKEKKINRLIKFFRDLSIHSYIYIYPYNEQCIEFYDILKESLVYYNNGEDDEAIALKMQNYIEIKEMVQKSLDADPYEIQMILPEKKVIKGEKDKIKRKCIYCGGSVGDDRTTFKEIAHAIPEALGNTKFFQNEECDSCNDYFARNVEEDLCNFLIWKRLQYGLKGKNGYPIFQLASGGYAKYFNYKDANYEEDWGFFESLKTIVKEKKIIGPIVVSKAMPKNQTNIEISYVKDYIPQHIYKTFVKCVIGLIGNENLEIFSATIKWLRYSNEYVDLPKVSLIKCKRLIKEPELYIFKRKDDNNYKIPYCYGELRILDTIFVFIIPFTKMDRYDFLNENENLQFKHILFNKYGKYEEINFSSLDPQNIEEQFVVCKPILF